MSDNTPDALLQLLAPLSRVEPVRRRRRSARRIWIGIATAALLVGGSVATAAGVGPLAGIGAAEHEPTAADALTPAATDQLHRGELPGDAIGARIPAAARLVGQLASGHRVYVVPTERGRLCVLVEGSAESCSDPLTQTMPITATIVDNDGPGGTPPIVYGVARDGVTSVSFPAQGETKTVLVHNNFWTYQGGGEFFNLTVHFADGSTSTLP